MLKLLVGLVGAIALVVISHAALVQTSKSESGAAPAARSICACPVSARGVTGDGIDRIGHGKSFRQRLKNSSENDVADADVAQTKLAKSVMKSAS